MKNKLYPIILKKDEKISLEIAKRIFGNDLSMDEIKLEIKTRTCWNIPVSVKGLAVSQNFDNGEITIHGWRTMTECRQSGYCLEGRVSVNGRKYTCFTSSQLFELENNHLISAQTIFPRIR